MRITQVNIDRPKLAAMPEKHRVLLLLLGHASNEINVLTKLLIMTRKDAPSSQIVEHVEAGQAIIIMRMLIGKLHEAWLLCGKRVMSDRTISSEFLPLLSPDAQAALETLKKHFGQSNSLPSIRNKVSFHYADDANLMETSFQQLPAEETLQFYLAPTAGNNFFHASEVVVQLGMLSLVKTLPADPLDTEPASEQAFTALCREVILVASSMVALFVALIGLLGQAAVHSHTDETVPECRKPSECPLPYFLDATQRP